MRFAKHHAMMPLPDDDDGTFTVLPFFYLSLIIYSRRIATSSGPVPIICIRCATERWRKDLCRCNKFISLHVDATKGTT